MHCKRREHSRKHLEKRTHAEDSGQLLFIASAPGGTMGISKQVRKSYNCATCSNRGPVWTRDGVSTSTSTITLECNHDS